MEKSEIIRQATELFESTSCDLGRIESLQETIMDALDTESVPLNVYRKIEAIATVCIAFANSRARQLDALCLSLTHA